MSTVRAASSGNGEVAAYPVTPEELEQLRRDAEAVERRPVRKTAAKKKARKKAIARRR